MGTQKTDFVYILGAFLMPMVILTIVLATFLIPVLSFADTSSSTLTSSTFIATSTASIIPPASQANITCYAAEQDAGFGKRDTTTDGAVTAIQIFLKSTGYIGINPTGYFGSITKNAVMAFQKDHNINATGYVGNLTRAAFIQMSCVPQSTSPIGVVTPNGGEKWSVNTIQTISWKYIYPTFAATEHLDILLVPTFPSCTDGRPCPMFMMIKPFTIATNTPAVQGSFAWNVGTQADLTRTIAPGTYKVEICITNSNLCDESDKAFTIVQ